MTTPAPRPEVAVLPIHFEDRSGSEFERLCFAYLVRAFEWKSIDWYGQLGGDRGRDVWGVMTNGDTECFQCANHARLAFRKVEDDLGKLAARPNGLPAKFTLITGGRVSAAMKARVVACATRVGIAEAEVWSGPEFEERLRRDEPLLVRRFVEGVPFPESIDALRAMSLDAGMADAEILALMAECFERPAFTTPFMQESSIPDFKQAITDTIEALNTGVRRLRDGTEIGRIPRRAQLKDPNARAALARVVDLLVELRAQYDAFIASGELRPCGCGQRDCSIFMIDQRAAWVMDDLRWRILDAFGRVTPDFAPRRQITCRGGDERDALWKTYPSANRPGRLRRRSPQMPT